jgi:hypothetical protein
MAICHLAEVYRFARHDRPLVIGAAGKRRCDGAPHSRGNSYAFFCSSLCWVYLRRVNRIRSLETATMSITAMDRLILRLEHARSHLQTFRNEVRAFMASEPFSISHETDPNTGHDLGVDST